MKDKEKQRELIVEIMKADEQSGIYDEPTMKQTAVEYLFKQLWDRPKDKLNWNYFLQKAKDMEREQILNAYGDGYFADQIKSVEQLNIYYDKTYGKK